MPTDIHRQGYWQIQQFPDFLQQMVYPMKFVGVLFPIIFIMFCNDRQEVFRFVYWIFINNLLHTFLENIFKHVISIDSFTTVLIQALLSFSGKEVYLKLELYISQGQFSQEILDFVNKDMEITEKEDGSGIGIKNVKEVLKMMYQQDHLLYFENLEPEGTKITIWIPKTLKCTDEEKDEER